ncbi:hypothetical protein PCURB6_28360 [Paenibacillus curdlanolyticus]|nr:hypothetical protein PCURB6_28360 [Paenibacillus curdlanolyticus]
MRKASIIRTLIGSNASDIAKIEALCVIIVSDDSSIISFVNLFSVFRPVEKRNGVDAETPKASGNFFNVSENFV